ncbi:MULTISPECIES: hypothetical protein [Sorangium]|uniref:hypothetical protein n=1 Tax=Sorangium TaxID=39643 RepID=UPI003D9C5BAA
MPLRSRGSSINVARYCRPVLLMLQPLASSMLRDGEEFCAAKMAIMEGARTRVRLVADELNLALGPITVPPPLPAEEQRATS